MDDQSAYVRGDIAFYAPREIDAASPSARRPVYAWSDGTAGLLSTMSSGLERFGFYRGDVAFYAPSGGALQ
jgi:hypothetical protein